MTTNAEVQHPQRRDVDANIRTVVRVWCSPRGRSLKQLRLALGWPESTWDRRMGPGGHWTAAEVEALAEVLRVPVGDLYAGSAARVDLREASVTQLLPTRISPFSRLLPRLAVAA